MKSFSDRFHVNFHKKLEKKLDGQVSKGKCISVVSRCKSDSFLKPRVVFNGIHENLKYCKIQGLSD